MVAGLGRIGRVKGGSNGLDGRGFVVHVVGVGNQLWAKEIGRFACVVRL